MIFNTEEKIAEKSVLRGGLRKKISPHPTDKEQFWKVLNDGYGPTTAYLIKFWFNFQMLMTY